MGRICWVPWLRSAALNNHDADLPSENCLSWQRRQRWEAHLITFGLIINSNYQLLQKSGPKLNFWREVSCKSIIVSIKARFIKNTHKSNKLQIEVEFKNITLAYNLLLFVSLIWGRVEEKAGPNMAEIDRFHQRMDYRGYLCKRH